MAIAGSNLAELPASDLLIAYRSRALSPVEVTVAALERIEALNPLLCAYVTVTPELALDQAHAAERAYREARVSAEQSLLGVPASVKDVVPTAGVRTTMGSRLFADWVPDHDAPLVERLRRAGAVLLGKTNLPELGWKGDSGNRLVGPTRNPFDPARTAGGSSGGAAVAVATGMGPLAQGGDGAGSIRIPAALTGVFGMKPSHGTIPYAPAGALELLVAEGPLTRTVDDAVLMLDALAGFDPRDRLSLPRPASSFREALQDDVSGLRVAYCPALGHPVAPEVAAVVGDAVAVFETELGCRIEQVPAPWADPNEIVDVFFASAYAGLHAGGYGIGADPDAALGELDPGLARLVTRGLGLSAADLTRAHLALLRFADQARAFMEAWDLLLTPTLPVTAFVAGEDQPPGSASPHDWLSTTYPFNLTGQPAATVPAGVADGLPLGLQVVGALRDDATVLAAAAAFERARPWVGDLRATTERLLAQRPAEPA
jgi:aspartyl-tRNA(Asn)/glutamyl-tRNA(Gln) amidotransferase subunit A